MTLCLAWNLQQYAMFAADSRITFFADDGTSHVEDDRDKVFEVPLGITTGSGMLHMANALFDVLNTAHKEDFLSLPKRFQEAESRARRGTPKDRWWSEHMERTGVFVASAWKKEVSVNLYHTDYSYDVTHVPVGFAGTLLPEKRDEFAPYESRLALESRALKRFKSLDASIEYHMKLAAAFMKRACLISPQLSESIQVGVIAADDSREITDVMPLEEFDVGPLELKGDELTD